MIAPDAEIYRYQKPACKPLPIRRGTELDLAAMRRQRLECYLRPRLAALKVRLLRLGEDIEYVWGTHRLPSR